MRPTVSIILLNWNSAEHTIECIESLQKIDYENVDITIVDNGSDPSSLEIIKGYLDGDIKTESDFVQYNRDSKPLSYTTHHISNQQGWKNSSNYITIIKNDVNSGFPGGCNIGIQRVLERNRDYVLLLNNDIVVDSQFLDELVDEAESKESAGILGSKVYYYDEPDRIQSIGGDMRWWMFLPLDYGRGEVDNGEFTKIQERDFVWATSQLIDTDVIRDVGLLDERFFFGIEEYDLCNRAKKAGYRVLFVPSSKVWHKGGASSKKLDEYPDAKSMVNSQTGVFNHKLISYALKKHYGSVVWFLPFILSYLYRVLRKIKKGVTGNSRKRRNNI